MTDKNKTAEESAVEDMVSGSVSKSELDKARKEGVLEGAKELAKESSKFVLDGNLPGSGNVPDYLGSEEIQLYADNLGLGVDAFKDAIAKDGAIPEEKVYGLLALERNGQNRTPYVKAMMDRLGLKADELPGGGPAYTNDLTALTEL